MSSEQILTNLQKKNLWLDISFNRDACDWLQYSTLQKHIVNERVVLKFETKARTQEHTEAYIIELVQMVQ